MSYQFNGKGCVADHKCEGIRGWLPNSKTTVAKISENVSGLCCQKKKRMHGCQMRWELQDEQFSMPNWLVKPVILIEHWFPTTVPGTTSSLD